MSEVVKYQVSRADKVFQVPYPDGAYAFGPCVISHRPKTLNPTSYLNPLTKLK